MRVFFFLPLKRVSTLACGDNSLIRAVISKALLSKKSAGIGVFGVRGIEHFKFSLETSCHLGGIEEFVPRLRHCSLKSAWISGCSSLWKRQLEVGVRASDNGPTSLHCLSWARFGHFCGFRP